MKFVILVHSTPQPWGHPTGDFVAAHQALPAQQREQMERDTAAMHGFGLWATLEQVED